MGIRGRVAAVSGLVLLASTLVVAQPATAAVVTAAELPSLLTVAPETTTPAYQRAKFEHWIDADGDGCNTRYEVLIEESTTDVTVTGRCTLSGGTWVSPYDGFATTSVTEIEIDHVVALAEAWRSGASGWTDAQRRDFANDIAVPYTLVASSTSANQSKADRDPAKWMPTNTAYHCEYVTGWALTKYRWSLTVDAAEQAALANTLSGACGEQPITLPEVMLTVDEVVEPPARGVVTPFANGTTRLAGSDRYTTAISVASKYEPGVPAVFVATGRNFPDALSASAAAALLGAPLLLTHPGSLPSAVRNEIVRLKPADIYVVGGPGVVSDAVEYDLDAIAPVTRLDGADRYETGLDIVNSTFASATHAVIATGTNFPDALGATGVAGSLGAPVILVRGNQAHVPDTVMETLVRLGVDNVLIAGGTSVVSSGIEQHLRTSGYTVTRYGGADRYETAALINRAHFGAGSSDAMFLATGRNFPDALAGAALAGRMAAPMYVTMPACVPAAVHDEINRLGATQRVVMGGQSVVSNNAAANTKCASAPKPPTGTYVKDPVTAGAFCAATVRGHYGYTSKGVLMQCKTIPGDSRLRWRAV